VLQPDGSLVQWGPSLARLCPDLAEGVGLEAVFHCKRPGIELSWASIQTHVDTLFILIHRRSGLSYRGSMMPLAQGQRMAFLGSPWITDSAQVQALGLSCADFAQHDPILDLLPMLQIQKTGLRDMTLLTEKLTRQRSELRQVNQRLADQARELSRMALIAARTDNGVVLTDACGVIEWVNQGFVGLTGYAAEEVVGKRPGVILQSAETDARTIQHMRDRLAAGQGFEVEMRNRHKSGHHYWVQVEVQPIHDDQGQLAHFMAIERDVTARHRDETRLALHYAITQLLSDAADPLRMFEELLKLLCSFLEWPFGAMWEVTPGGKGQAAVLRCGQVWASSPGYEDFMARSRELLFTAGEGMPGRVWQQQQAVFVPDVATDDNFPRAPQAAIAGLHAALALPVMQHGKLSHVLEFLSPGMAPLDEALTRILEGVCAQVSHFLERKRDEARVHQLMAEFDSLFQLSPDGFIVFNDQGVRSYANPAFFTMTGLERDQVDAVTEEEFDALLTTLCDPHQAPQKLNLVATQKDGDQLHLVRPRHGILKRSVRDMHDRVGHFIGRAVYFRDITHESEVDRMKSEFLSTAAHELRTPMASVHGFSELLLRRKFSDEARKDIYETIHRQSTLLVNMVTELLDLARIEARAGKDFDIRARDVKPMVDGAVRSLLMPGDERQVSVDCPDGLPQVLADEDKFVRALTNILSNAYKYSPNGGSISLDVLQRDGKAGAELGIRVTDEGLGMTPEQLARLFERFFRADPSGAIPGTGLGMSLVKEIMSLMGGETQVTSEAGRGTQVVLWLRVMA
jgi:PAS domain S-box-containing protein